MVLYDIRFSLTSREGVGEETGRELMEVVGEEIGREVMEVVGEEIDRELMEVVGEEIGKELMEIVGEEIDRELVEVTLDFMHETPATPTCLIKTLPSLKESRSEEHSASFSSDPVQATVDKCSVLSGLP